MSGSALFDRYAVASCLSLNRAMIEFVVSPQCCAEYGAECTVTSFELCICTFGHVCTGYLTGAGDGAGDAVGSRRCRYSCDDVIGRRRR